MISINSRVVEKKGQILFVEIASFVRFPKKKNTFIFLFLCNFLYKMTIRDYVSKNLSIVRFDKIDILA